MSKLHSLAISSLTLASISFALAACGGASNPQQLPAEVPMDPSTGGSSASSSDPSTTAATTTTSASSSDGDPSAAMAGGMDPSGGAAAAPAPAADPTPDPKPGKNGKGKKGGLSKSECQALSAKGVDLLIAGMEGMDPSMAAQIKSQAASDPNMAGMMGECQKTTTRAQYTCGMAATSKEAWQTCLK
jgi:hypothetical protein